MPVMILALFPFALILAVLSLVLKNKDVAYGSAIASLIFTFPIVFTLSTSNAYPTLIIVTPLFQWASAYFIKKDKKWLAILGQVPLFAVAIWTVLLLFIK